MFQSVCAIIYHNPAILAVYLSLSELKYIQSVAISFSVSIYPHLIMTCIESIDLARKRKGKKKL